MKRFFKYLCWYCAAHLVLGALTGQLNSKPTRREKKVGFGGAANPVAPAPARHGHRFFVAVSLIIFLLWAGLVAIGFITQ